MDRFSGSLVVAAGAVLSIFGTCGWYTLATGIYAVGTTVGDVLKALDGFGIRSMDGLIATSVCGNKGDIGVINSLTFGDSAGSALCTGAVFGIPSIFSM